MNAYITACTFLIFSIIVVSCTDGAVEELDDDMNAVYMDNLRVNPCVAPRGPGRSSLTH